MTTRTLLAATLFVSLAGCPQSVIPLYEDARDKALADPGATPKKWQPDLVVHLSKPLVRDAVDTLLAEHATLKDTIEVAGIGSLSPKLKIDALKLSGSDACKECLSVRTELSGNVAYKVLGMGDSVPLKATAKFDTKLEAAQDGDTWTVTLEPKQIRALSIDVDGMGGKVKDKALGPLEKWVEKNLIAKIPPLKVAQFGSKESPLLGLRVLPAEEGLRIGMLTASPTSKPVEIGDSVPEEGWRAWISEESITGLAAKEAFKMGVISHDVVVEPKALDVKKDGFDLTIRLWRIKGKGWWRDYTAKGKLEVNDKKVKLVGNEVVEGDKSKGAVFVDPLAALGEGIILKVIEDNITQTMPSQKSVKSGDMKTNVKIGTARGRGNAVVVNGSLDLVVVEPKKEEPTNDKGKKGKGKKGGKSKGKGGKNK